MRKAFIVGIILCVGSVLVPAAATGAKADRATTGTPSVSVTPSTGLLDGQSLAVAASGLAAKVPYGVAECQAGATSIDSCSLSGLRPIKSDKTGSFSTSVTAVRMIEGDLGGNPVDCAVDACILAVIGREPTVLASTPISFADVAIVPPTLSADPSTGLLDGQKINVGGTGWSADASVAISECPTAVAGAFCGDGLVGGHPVSATGVLSATFKVTRVLDGQNGPIDCAQPAACELVAFNLEDSDQMVGTPISLADVTIIPPVLRAAPSADLVDGQAITVTGKGFQAHENIDLTECAAGSLDGSECSDAYESDAGPGTNGTRANGSGRFSTTFQTARVLTLYNGTVDCAVAPGCVVGAINEDDGFESVEAMAPLGFNPAVAPLPPLNLELTIDPTGKLVPGAKGGGDPEITGTISCARATPVPVQFQLQVSQGVSPDGSRVVFGEASCQEGGASFSETVPSPRRDPAVPGIAGVLLDVSATSGSASQSTSVSASVTLVASGSS